MVTTEDDILLDKSCRPKYFDSYIGQNDFIRKMKITIQAAIERGSSLPHCLISGNSGFGKTTICEIISNEAGCHFTSINAASVQSINDLIGVMVKLGRSDVLFLDEIHRLNKKVCESLYPVMSDFKVSMKAATKQVVTIPLEQFCLMGATTEIGKLPEPFKQRFEIQYNMLHYSNEEIKQIISVSGENLELNLIDDEAIGEIANRSRGVPRVAIRLLKRSRDYAQIKNNNNIDSNTVKNAMFLEGIDEIGLTEIDKNYISVLYNTYMGGPCGLSTLATTINEDESIVESFVEPYLIRLGFIARGKQGRYLTGEGIEYIIKKGLINNA